MFSYLPRARLVRGARRSRSGGCSPRPPSRRADLDGDGNAARGRPEARLGDQHRPRPILDLHGRLPSLEHEPCEGSEGLPDGGYRVPDLEPRPLESADALDEAVQVVTEQLTALAGAVDQPRARAGG